MFTQGALNVPRNDTYESKSSSIFKFLRNAHIDFYFALQMYISTNVCSLSPKSTPAFAVIFVYNNH